MSMQAFRAIFSGYFTRVTNLKNGINVINALLEEKQLYRHIYLCFLTSYDLIHCNNCIVMHAVKDVKFNTWSPQIVILMDDYTWGVQVVRYPNFFVGEWKQIET